MRNTRGACAREQGRRRTECLLSHHVCFQKTDPTAMPGHTQSSPGGHAAEGCEVAGAGWGAMRMFPVFKFAFSFGIFAHPRTVVRNHTEGPRALEPVSPMETPCKPGFDMDTAHQSCPDSSCVCVCVCDCDCLRARSHVHPAVQLQNPRALLQPMPLPEPPHARATPARARVPTQGSGADTGVRPLALEWTDPFVYPFAAERPRSYC